MARHSLMPLAGNVISRDPFWSLQRSMNKLFEDAFRGSPAVGDAGDLYSVMPQLNISETDREFRVTAELPGVAEKDVDVTLDDDVLTIRGEKKLEKREEKENYHVVERSYGQFQRSIRVPHSVKGEQVQARVENGVLTIVLPKNQAQEKARHIEVKGGAH